MQQTVNIEIHFLKESFFRKNNSTKNIKIIKIDVMNPYLIVIMIIIFKLFLLD